MNIIQDIIDLKKKHNLLEDDATDEKQREWYGFAIQSGLVITYYANNELKGFCEFVKLIKLPNTLDDVYNLVTDYKTGDVCFVSNCIAEDSKILWELKRILFALNRGVNYFVWHRKKYKSLFKNRRINA